MTRTSAHAFDNVTWPHALRIADLGWQAALVADPHLAAGLNVAAGRLPQPSVASALGYDVLPSEKAVAA